jgi:predicted lipoprotein with Yx(FWY)xxD motif
MAIAAPPDTPIDVSLFFENGQYVFRVGESQSIYVYDRDVAGTPTCIAECARRWPPVLASAGSKPVGGWTLVKRDSDSLQWCYRNRPVYTYADDKPGESTGNGFEGVWHVVVP